MIFIYRFVSSSFMDCEKLFHKKKQVLVKKASSIELKDKYKCPFIDLLSFPFSRRRFLEK